VRYGWPTMRQSVERRAAAEELRPESAPVVKEHDSPIAVLVGGGVAARLLPAARRLGIAPTAVTLSSFALTLAAAALIAAGPGGGAAWLAFLLVEIGFCLDCLDGQLARATGRVSDFGRYLDSLTDVVKVFAVVAALIVWASRTADAGEALALGMVALLGYLLCEEHTQIARQLPQLTQRDYERSVAPWKERLRIGSQKVDLAFAIGEVLTVAALATLARSPRAGLWVLAVMTPVQFVSYGVRFWRYRYRAR